MKQLRDQGATFAGESAIRLVFEQKEVRRPPGTDGGIPIAGYFMSGI
jgi:hypothetical protein